MATHSNAIVFFGTDNFAVMVLRKLIEHSVTIACVVTTPPRPAGRGLKERKSEVAIFCASCALHVKEIDDLNAEDTRTLLSRYQEIIFVVVSYGKIVPSPLLSLSHYPMINLHPSLLPRWRGPSPIQTALLAGDEVTGVSIIKITPEIDGGAVFAQKEIPIDERINAEDLEKELAQEGAILLENTIASLYANEMSALEQEPSRVTRTKKFTKEDGEIDWSDTNVMIHNKIRALVMWPTAFTKLDQKKIKIFSSLPVECDEVHVPGEIIAITNDGPIRVMTGNGALDIFEVQAEGKKRMHAFQFSCGARLNLGQCLGGGA